MLFCPKSFNLLLENLSSTHSINDILEPVDDAGSQRKCNRKGGVMIAKMHKSKFAVLLIAVVLILGLTLPACACGEPTLTEEPPAPSELSFEAAEYTNAGYSFSVKYPNDWAESAAEGPIIVFAAQAPSQVPALIVAVAEGTTFADVLTAALEEAGGSDIEITSESETTLADGTPASEAIVKAKMQGLGADGFSLGAMKDNEWVIVTIVTVKLLAKYDEALFSEIAHTLQFE